MSNMKIVYVAGPYRASTPWDVEQNVRRAEEIALEVWGLGYYALCPHKNAQHFDKLYTEELWIEGTLEFLRRSDAMVICGDWSTSSGTKGEIAEAEAIGMPWFKDIDELRKYHELAESDKLDQIIQPICGTIYFDHSYFIDSN